MENNVVKKQAPFSVVIQSDMYKKLINNTLGDSKRATRFIASITSAVATNPTLQECEPSSVLASSLVGEALNLSPSNALGEYYLVPYSNAKKGTKEAQIQIGYKGYLHLAIRSGQYKDIDVFEIHEGEFKGRDKDTGKYKFEFIENEEERLSKPVIGYMGYFELLNGFRKTLYMSKEEMLNHADTYSKAFNKADYEKYINGQIPQRDLWKFSSYWYKSFQTMAFKTILRQLISKWGIMSIEMQDAFTKDMAVIKEDGTCDYVDNPEEDKTIIEVEHTEEEPKKMGLDDIQ
jgi:recombination protein RecT